MLNGQRENVIVTVSYIQKNANFAQLYSVYLLH